MSLGKVCMVWSQSLWLRSSALGSRVLNHGCWERCRNATTRKNGKYSKGCRELMWHDFFKDVRQMV